MQYRKLYTDRENYYSVGIDEESGEHLIEVVITWIAWYSIYFRLLPEEIASFQQDPRSLVSLANQLARDKGQIAFKDRLVRNEGPTR